MKGVQKQAIVGRQTGGTWPTRDSVFSLLGHGGVWAMTGVQKHGGFMDVCKLEGGVVTSPLSPNAQVGRRF